MLSLERAKRFHWNQGDLTLQAKTHAHAPSGPRFPNGYERRCDFAQIKDTLNEAETRAVAELSAMIRDMQDRFFKFVRDKFDHKLSFLDTIKELRGMPSLGKRFQDLLLDVMQKGSNAVGKELGVTKHATAPNLNPQAASGFLKTKADFFITGLNKQLTDKAREILANAIDMGEPTEKVMERLRLLFLPYVGNGKAITDPAVITPHRLETIVRTNFTDAYNRGRLIEGRQAGDLITGYEYSAILDERTTEVCKYMDGKVFRADDPELDRFRPPLHFNCRSVLVPITLDVAIDPEDVVTEDDLAEARDLAGDGFGGEPGNQPSVKPSNEDVAQMLGDVISKVEDAADLEDEDLQDLLDKAKEVLKTRKFATPDKRSLYLSRPVVNARSVIAWARQQGFKQTLAPEDLHVTIAFSRKPVDWAAIPDAADQIKAKTGARTTKPLGDKGAVVLAFESDALSQRWKELIEKHGASWDHEGYHPHITISYDAKDVDLSKVKPYDGPIVLGPERMEEVEEDWDEKIKEVPAK